MFTVKNFILSLYGLTDRFRNISCLRLRLNKQKERQKHVLFKNISCLRLSPFNNLFFLGAINLKTFHVYG